MTSSSYVKLIFVGGLALAALGVGCETAPKQTRYEDNLAKAAERQESAKAKCQKRKSELELKAEAGDTEAQYQMGVWHLSACGGYDKSKAAEWYERAAVQGYRRAQYEIANMYLSGAGVPQDTKKAENWHREAAEQGHAISAHTLGDIYYEGKYASKDLDKALEWYRIAAERGHISAYRALGYMYFTGEGVERNLIEAEKWFSIAAAKGDIFSQDELENIAKENWANEKDPVAWANKEPARIAAEEQRRREAQTEARERAAEQERLTREKAKQAKARFGSISLRVREAEETKRLRAKVRLRELSMGGDDSSDFFDLIGGGVGVGADMGSLGGPGGLVVGAGVGAAMGLIMAIADAVDGDSGEKLPDEEKAKIKEAVTRLTKVLAEENVEQNLQLQLQALAEQQQVGDLLQVGSAADISSIPHQLNIEVQEIGLFKVSGDKRSGRLWFAANAKLVNAKQGDEPIETRICYGSRDAHPLVSWSEVNGEKLNKGLTRAYRYISNQILTEIVGLAPDPDTTYTWKKTALACVVYKQEPYKPGER